MIKLNKLVYLLRAVLLIGLLVIPSTHAFFGSLWNSKPKKDVNKDDKDASRDFHADDVFRRHKKRSSADYFGSAVYFDGYRQHLRLRFLTKRGRISIPNENFTVQFWTKPEGGQSTYTPIVEIYDECDNHVSSTGWVVGISTKSYERRDARFVFSMLTENAEYTSHLFAHKQYDPRVWTNIAATYNGEVMSLYINGARISLTNEQRGVIFPKSKSKCKLLFLGGNSVNGWLYRGKVDEIRLWNRKLEHTEITSNMHIRSEELEIDSHLLIADSFDEKDLTQWRVKPSMLPEVVKSDIPLFDHHIRFEAPHCGKTVCDDPSAVMSYVNNAQLRSEKTLRLRIVNIMDDDGTNPTISDKQFFEQERILNKVYKDYNISFDVENFKVKNSTLRHRVIMFECVPYKIGDGVCDKECGHSTTGNDGGDCDDVHAECLNQLLGNGVCDSECNKVYHNYDDGDCCLHTDDVTKTCIDPIHPLRAYINVEDLKVQLKLDGSSTINIFFITASWFREIFRGVATFPWEKNVYTSVGGNIFHVDSFGNSDKMESFVHEMGHNLGLWHTHRGISEVPCDDPCYETHPSMILGDLCSDTNPTPRNRFCSDPRPDQIDEDTACRKYNFVDTPYTNYMGYASDSCTETFTPQQVARMHCYLDLVYQPMREMKYPAPIPLAPKVVGTSGSSVRMVWIEPLGTDTSCDADGALYQYADVATSSHSGVRWSPQEATGFPDGKKCFPSPRSWMPSYNMYPPTCEDRSCWLELGFVTTVAPKRINIWINDVKEDTEIVVELLSPSGQIEYSRTAMAYCDMETTLLVDTEFVVDKIRIYTTDSYVAVDAVQMVSKPNFALCTKRKSTKYRVYREPAFSEGYIVSPVPEFTDTSVEPLTKYTYRIQAVLDSRPSVMSPVLVYTHGKEFCGDGIVNSDEDCDDKNVFDGDGCSVQCKIEEGFNCKGSPSLCYIYTNDGMCEDFEIGDNIADCGFHTPDGFVDQWALTATASPEQQTAQCPASAITGKPDMYQVTIYKPVVAIAVIVHLASDGITRINSQQKYIYVDLITPDSGYTPVNPGGVPVSCNSNPLHIGIQQNLNESFVLTKGVRVSFTYSSISISGIRVRSTPSINPLTIESCGKEELYNPRSGLCVKNTCSKLTCEPYPVKRGVAECTGVEEGDTCTIHCDEGYYVDSHDNTALCSDGEWIMSSPLQCLPVECGRPYIHLATVACSDGTHFDQKCFFKCNKPATVTGDDTSIKCLSDGSWSKPEATCEITCPALDPDMIRFGSLKTDSCQTGSQQIGTECRVRCNEGYHVSGEKNKKRILRFICEDDGEWDGTECIPNQCDPLPVMFNGAYSCTDGFNSGSTCSMGCRADLAIFQEVHCDMEGEWDGTFSVCPSDREKQCDVIKNTPDIMFDCDDRLAGDRCSVTCREAGYQAVIRAPADDDPCGAVYTNVDHIECSVLQNWEPGPDVIQCVKPCISDSIGDGFCEAENNREYCDWDGGDCCTSTVDGGEVITFPEYCPVDCKCKDPCAIENRRRKRKKRKHRPNGV